MINHYDPFEAGYGRTVNLSQAIDDMARQITQSNTYEQIDQAAGYSMVFAGTSPVTGEEERVTLITREMGDGPRAVRGADLAGPRLHHDRPDLPAHGAQPVRERRRRAPRAGELRR